MVRRILAVLAGLALCATVAYLGLRVNDGPLFVVAFGIASALLAPVGLASLGYAFQRGDRQILERLARVPEIQRLIAEANSQEEKIRLLELERTQLLETVQFEAQKRALLDREQSLEREGKRILAELEAIDRDLRTFDAKGTGVASEEIERLHARLRARQKGDIVIRIGKQYLTLDAALIRELPFGSLVLLYARFLGDLFRRLSRPQT
jgi:23S rRNA pseudoU1915 N3-methylase RlmH